MLKHGLMPDEVTKSGRSDMFSVVFTARTERRAEGDLRDIGASSYSNTGYDSEDYVKTSLEGYHVDSEVAVVIDTQVAHMEWATMNLSFGAAEKWQRSKIFELGLC